MLILGVFVAVLIAGLYLEKFSWEAVGWYVAAGLASWVAIKLLHIPLFWVQVPILVLNVILILVVFERDIDVPRGSGGY